MTVCVRRFWSEEAGTKLTAVFFSLLMLLSLVAMGGVGSAGASVEDSFANPDGLSQMSEETTVSGKNISVLNDGFDSSGEYNSTAPADRDPFPIGGGPDWGDIGANVTMAGITQALVELDDEPAGTEAFVVYEVDADGNWSEELPHFRDGLELRVGGLAPETQYNVTVQAVDADENVSDDGPVVGFETGSLDDFDWPAGSELEATNTTDRTATLTWPEAEPADEVVAYSVTATPVDGEEGPSTQIFRDEDWNFTVFDGDLMLDDGEFTYETGTMLEPETEYEFVVTAQLAVGVVSDPLTATATTDDAMVPEWPEGAELDVIETTGLTATLTWLEADPSADIEFYYLIVTETGEEVPVATPTIGRDRDGNFTVGDGHLTLDDGEFTYETGEVLYPETEYDFETLAQLGPEFGDPLNATGTTGQAAPPEWDETVNATVTETAEDRATVEVEGYPVPFEFFEELVFFDENDTELPTTALGDLEHELIGLAANTSYEVTVEVEDTFGGVSSDGPIVEFTTSDADGPRNFAAAAHRTNVSLSWNGPETGTYIVSRNGTVVATLDAANLTTLAYEDSGLEAETVYEYELTREVDGGVSGTVSDTATTGLIGATARTSLREDGTAGPNTNAWEAELSGDGQYVVYSYSQTEDLFERVYRHNVSTGEREQVSVYGPEGFTFETPFRQPSISDDGNEVAFVSTGGTNQVYVRDVGANETTLVSYFEDAFGDKVEGDGPSSNPSISGDGRYVAFESTATELVDGNVEGANVYVYDREENEMELIPVENTELSMQPDISPGGDVVVFESDNHELADLPGDVPDDQKNVFLYDRNSGEFEWVSEPNDGSAPDGRSTDAAVTVAGDYVAFLSSADNLTDDEGGVSEIYRYNRSAQTVDLVSVDTDGEPITTSRAPAITPDGRYIAFASYRVDTETGITSDFGYNNTGDPWEWSFSSGSPVPNELSISDDGTQVGYRIAPFGVNVPNLVPDDDGNEDAYVTFLGNDSVLDPLSWGDQEVETSDVLAGELNLSWDGLDDAKYYAVFVDDSQYATTSSQTTELTVGSLAQGVEHEFRVEAMNERGVLSVDGPSTTETMANLTAPTSTQTRPYDVGVLFEWSDDFTGGDLSWIEVYRDGEYAGSGNTETMRFLDSWQVEPGTTYNYEIEFWDAHSNIVTTLATATTLPEGAGIETDALDRDEDGELFDGGAFGLDTSADGELAVIQSLGDPLGLPEDAGQSQVYLRDSDDSIELLSRPDGSGADEAGDGASGEPHMSENATEVVFRSDSSNLDVETPNIDSGIGDQLYVRDRTATTTRLLTQNDSGEMANSFIDEFDVSRDASRVVFTTQATNLVEDVTDDDRRQAIVYDRDTGEMTLASRGIDGQPADDWVNEPAISADGEYVTFRTRAANLVENTTNDQADIYRYEVATGDLERVSVTPDGAEIPNPDPGGFSRDDALAPTITEDGSEVGFLSSSEGMGADGDDYLIFVWDNETGVTELVEANPLGEYDVDSSVGLSFSSDGRFVAFGSETRFMVPRDKSFGELHLYVHDRAQAYTLRGDVNSMGDRADTEVEEMVRLADTDAPTLLYRSSATNLDDDLDGSVHRAFRTEFTRFDAIADVDPPSWPPNATLDTTPLGQTSIALTWPSAIHELGIDSYVVDIEGVSENVTVSGGESGVTVDDLESNTTYTFDVYAVDATGQESPALTANETTLSADDLVSLLAEVDGGAVSLEWEPAAEGSGIEGYVVQNRELTGESEGNWTDRLTLEDCETTTATDTGLVGNTTYEYRVLGVDAGGERVPHTTTTTVDVPPIAVEQALWQVIDGERVGSTVTPESTIGVTVIGEPNWEASGTVTYTVWDDPAGDTPETETTTLSFAEDSTTDGRYEANFTLAPRAAAVTDVEVALTNGESGVETQVENLPLTVFANLTVETDWPADVEFPEDARLDVWNASLQDGDSKTFDEERTYVFEQIDAGVDVEAEYRVRVRDRFTGQVLVEEFETVRAGLATNTTIDDPLAPATLNVSVVDPSGDSVSAGLLATDLDTDRMVGSVLVSESDDSRPIATGSRLLAGEEIELSLRGTTAVPYRFDTTKTVELESGLNEATVALEEWGENVTVSGIVTDEDGIPVDGADISAVQRYGQTSWSGFRYTTTTDADGEYELSVRPEGDLSMSVTHRPEDGIRNVGETTVEVDSNPVESDLVLDRQRKRTIELESIVYDLPGVEDPVTLGPFGRAEADGLNVRIRGDNTDTWRASRTGTYPYNGWIADGEHVELCARTDRIGVSGLYCEEFVLGEADTDIGVELNLTEEEDATVSGVVTADLRTPDGDQWDRNASGDTTGWTARLYEKRNSEYETLRTFGGSDGDVSFNLADEGEYRLRFVGDYLGVSQFTETTFELDSEEPMKDLGEISMGSEGRFGFQSGNTVTGPSAPVMAGGDGTVRANYENAGEGSVSDVEVSVDLPGVLSYVEGSIVHTGDATADEDDVVVDDGTVTLPLGTLAANESGTIRLDVQVDPETDTQDLEVPATISFDDGGHETEWLGSADVLVGALSLSAPSQVGTHEIEASGRAPAESTVQLYADSVRIGETTAAPNGLWQLSTTLPAEDPDHEYDLRASAKTENETQESPSVTVTYSPGEPQLETVRFRQSDDSDEVANLPPIALGNIDLFLPATSDWVSFSPGANTRFPRTMLAGLSFEFELEYDRPEDVENAYVFVDGPAGGIGGVNDTGTLQEGTVEDDVFVITIPTDRAAPWSLGEICVGTNVPDEAIPPTGSLPQDSDVLDDIYGIFGDECDPVATPAWKIDPSGYVYEVERNNTITGVTATVFEKDESGEFVEWDAEWWGEENPQQTDAAGWYGWDVPAGEWRVVYEKDGYETAYSQDTYGPIEVPPPRFDVDVPLKSLEPPEVESITHDTTNDEVTIEFNRHVDIATVSENTVFVERLGNDSERVDADIVFPETVANPHTESTDETLSMHVRLELAASLEDGDYEVVVRDLVESYAEIPLSETVTKSLDLEPGLATYANENGVVDTGGLLDAIGDWRGNDIDTSLLLDVINAWRSGESVV